MFPVDRATSRQPRKWTPAEDQILRAEVESQMVEGEVKDWCRIAAKLPGRTNKDCRKRWHNSVAGGLKKGQWARSEDVQLAKGVHKFGQRWTLVAEVVGSRSADQCAKRWQQSLDPELDRSEWRESEDRVLIQAVQELGRHWKDIQHLHFPGRSKNCIKNRYTVLLRRYQNQATGSSQLSTGSPGLIPPNETSSFYGEDDSDAQSYAGNYALDGSSLRNSPAPLSTSGDSDLWTKPFPEWENDVQMANQQHFSNASLQPANIATSNYWNWSDSSMPSVPASMSSSPYMDFEMLPPNSVKQDSFFQLTPSAIQPLSTPMVPSTYALAAPMTGPTSAPLHRRAHSGFNSSPASPSLRAAAMGAHLRRPNSAHYTNNTPDAHSMAQFMAAMHHGNGTYGMR